MSESRKRIEREGLEKLTRQFGAPDPRRPVKGAQPELWAELERREMAEPWNDIDERIVVSKLYDRVFDPTKRPKKKSDGPKILGCFGDRQIPR